MYITEKANQQIVRFPFVKNDLLEIGLPSMSSAGFLWEISTFETSVLQFESMDFIANSETIGSGGITVAKFRTVHTGISKVVMIYRRPWLTETSKMFSVTIDLEKEII